MSIISYSTLKSIMFRLEPETAHNLASIALRTIGALPPLHRYLSNKLFISDPRLSQNLFGREFANPVGLAAGFDKDAGFIKGIAALGFGFTEVGTVTPRPQPGNPKPRLFRLIDECSIQNAMGFNNKGSYHMIKRLKKEHFFDYPVGINIGKNKTTLDNEALKDYKTLFKALQDYSTYIVINISSPNTPGLRDLQNENFINEVFRIGRSITDKPILLKIAPDMKPKQAVKLCKTAVEAGASGIIATNTTIDYSLSDNAKDFGGISGELLREKSCKIFKKIAQKLYGKTVLISAGGISTPEEAYKRIKTGASLVQVYTGLIYEGPELAKRINKGLIKLIKADGYSNISEAVGADWR